MYVWILKYPLLVQVFKLSFPFNQSWALNSNFQTLTKRDFSFILIKVCIYIYIVTSQNALHNANITYFTLSNFNSVARVILSSEKCDENCYIAKILK